MQSQKCSHRNAVTEMETHINKKPIPLTITMEDLLSILIPSFLNTDSSSNKPTFKIGEVFSCVEVNSDHTVGLDTSRFFDRLKQRGNSFLYCSAITKILLLGNKQKYGRLAPYVKTLETLCPTTIDIPAACDEDKNSTVLVTLLPAGHCLGSVMFLFEGDEGNVLYTGDFRWGMSEATRMPYLDPRSKPLRSIYVDTTFCCPTAFHIPSREQCESGVISLVDSYFQEHGTNGHIWMESRTSFGHEMLLKEISLHTKMKIHVVHWKKILYDQIPGLKDIFTEDPEETRIHAHPKDIYKRFEKNTLPCGYVPADKKMHLIQIKPSTMWFTTLPEIGNIVTQQGEHMYRACYSFHSSYAEIRDLIQYLKPARVFPSVIPTSKTFDQVQNILNSFLTTKHYKHFSSEESQEQTLGIMKISKKSSSESASIGDCVFDDSQNQSANSQEENTNPNSQSSYAGSHKSGSELNLYSDEESVNLSQKSVSKDEPAEDSVPSSGSLQTDASLPTYIEDNSDDSEYEEDESAHLKLQIDFDSSKPEDENEESVERSQDVLEKSLLAEKTDGQEMKESQISDHTLKLGAGDYFDEEHKREKKMVAAGDVSDANSNRQGDKVEELCPEKVDEKEADISGQKSVDEPDIKDRTSAAEIDVEVEKNQSELNICERGSVCALDILAQTCVDELNVREQTMSDVRSQTCADDSDNDEHSEDSVGDDVSSNLSLNGNSMDSYCSGEEKSIDNDELNAKTDMAEHRSAAVKSETLDHFNFKLPELEERVSSSNQNKKHKLNKDEDDKHSRKKYCKIDSENVKRSLHGRIPLEDNDVVETSNDEEMSEIKLQAGKAKDYQNKNQILDSNSCRRVGTDETLQENSRQIKCDNARSSFDDANKRYHQSLKSDNTTLHGKKIQSSFDNRVSTIVSNSENFSMLGTHPSLKKSNNTKELNSSQESESSVKIIQEPSRNQRTFVVEISDSEDECIAIDSDSDITVPPSPGFLESSQELFSSTDAIRDPSNTSDMTDNDEVIFIKTSTPIQNAAGKIKKRESSVIKLD